MALGMARKVLKPELEALEGVLKRLTGPSFCHSEPLPPKASPGRHSERGICFLNRNKRYYVYILASRSRNLYTGVTNNLERRVFEHKQGSVPGFTRKYRIHRLVYFELFDDIRQAIVREKRIKSWRREKRTALISRNNPAWDDLAAEWYDKKPSEKQIPRPECFRDSG